MQRSTLKQLLRTRFHTSLYTITRLHIGQANAWFSRTVYFINCLFLGAHPYLKQGSVQLGKRLDSVLRHHERDERIAFNTLADLVDRHKCFC